MKFQGVEIIFDEAHTIPDFILVAPWVRKRMKKTKKMFSRRDKRRKHKRHD